MSAKTRATPKTNLNCNLPRSVFTKSLEADGIQQIISQVKRHRLPSAVTTNTQKLRTIETTFDTGI
jgi:hypothetical protein